jgi:hypothetical protein
MNSSDSFDIQRDRYIDILKPIFLPKDPVSNDIIRYFASLLRVLGMEDQGWDPYVESESLLGDINNLFSADLPVEKFPVRERTNWRLGLLMYTHIIEMSAPYEVILNLLRFQLNEGYSPNPFYKYLTSSEKKAFQKYGIKVWRKIEIIKQLAERVGSDIGKIFDVFYDPKLRNAFGHSDYTLTDEDFRARLDISGIEGFRMNYEELGEKILNAKAFIAAYFYLNKAALGIWGQRKGEAIPYDPHYKGLMEVLADENDQMCGFKVHWPNGSESTYKRTNAGTDMINCMVSRKDENISLFVGQYARNPDQFSPLVERGVEPIYTVLEHSGIIPRWPDNI